MSLTQLVDSTVATVYPDMQGLPTTQILQEKGVNYKDFLTTVLFTQKHPDITEVILKKVKEDTTYTYEILKPRRTRTRRDLDVFRYVGNKLREYRVSKKWTQMKVAEMMGIPQPTVSLLERGLVNVYIPTYRDKFTAIGIDLDSLIKEAEKYVEEKEPVVVNEIFKKIRTLHERGKSLLEQEFLVELGARVKTYRFKNNLTKVELANEARVTLDLLEKIEEGEVELPENEMDFHRMNKVYQTVGIDFLHEIDRFLQENVSYITSII